MFSLEPSQIFVKGAGSPTVKLLDVRAPLEVEHGALPYCAFEPILTDSERHQVGIQYKEKGQESAIELGYELTGPYLPSRIQRWRDICSSGPTAAMCWRGGLRSQLTLEFMDLPEVPRVAGGYKALRQYLIEQMPQHLLERKIVVLTGLTGSGKTRLLKALEGASTLEPLKLQGVDLEGLANHRGSAFGNQGKQPAQATFENHLAADILLSPAKTLLLEDESRNIGQLELPGSLWETMRGAQGILLEASVKERSQQIFEDYVQVETARLGQEELRQNLEGNFNKLKQRLGAAQVERGIEMLEDAQKNGAWLKPESHQPWIELLLEGYYDPLYRKGLEKSGREIVFRGSFDTVLEHLQKKARG